MKPSPGELSVADLRRIDRRHIWHPYAASNSDVPVYPVASTDGVHIVLEDGRRLVDGMSSWWAAIHGYNHPRLLRAIDRQLQRMPHVMFGGLTHRPAVELAQRLVSLTPDALQRVFFCDSGSVSVEVALKMALQYWRGRRRPEKRQMMTLRGGYHGDTFAAMSVCDPEKGMHRMFAELLPRQVFVDRPLSRFGETLQQADLDKLRALFDQHHQHIAAMILEPIVQGAGGMHFYAAAYLREVRRLCDEFEVLLIADEVATGFGRSGRLFACEHADITPDILCVGKALTGGTMSFAAVLSTDEVCAGVDRSEAGVLMHGPTFMGNPLACAAAIASIDLLVEQPWQQLVLHIEAQLRAELAPLVGLPQVADVRVLGAIAVVELRHPVDMRQAVSMAVDMGVWLRPFGTLVYAMPPYIADDQQLAKIGAAMRQLTLSQSAEERP